MNKSEDLHLQGAQLRGKTGGQRAGLSGMAQVFSSSFPQGRRKDGSKAGRTSQTGDEIQTRW